MHTSTRRSPIAAHLAGGPVSPAAGDGPAPLSHPTDLLKVGVKGAGLARWAGEHGFPLPAGLYDTVAAGPRGLLARVGSGEIILEAPPDAPELVAFERVLAAPSQDVQRIEQQSATFELTGPRAKAILAQTCALNLAEAAADRILFTRVAGVSCGIIPRRLGTATHFRLWVDYTYAPYLWETLATIRDQGGAPPPG